MKGSGTFGFDRRNLGRICGLYSEIRNGVVEKDKLCGPRWHNQESRLNGVEFG